MVHHRLTHGPTSNSGRLLATSALVAVLVTVVLWPTRASGQDPLIVSVAGIDESTPGVVRVVVTVDRSGRPVTALDDIKVELGGQRLELRAVTAQTDALRPMDVVLAIDVSGSMAGETILRAQEAAIELIRSLAPVDRAALVTFASSVRIAQGLTDSAAALEAAIRELRAGGDTALFDGVAQAAALVAPSPERRAAIIVLSDGEDFGARSTATRDSAIAAAIASGAVVYTVGVGESFDRSFLQELSATTAGRFFEAGGGSDLPPLYQLLATILKGQFTIEFERPPSFPATGAVLTIRAGDATGSVNFELSPIPPTPTATATPPRPSLTPTAAPAALPSAGATAVPRESGDSSSAAPIVFAALGGSVALGLAGLLIWRWRRRVRVPVNEPPHEQVPDIPPAPAPAQAPVEWSAVFRVSGPGMDGADFPGGPGPVAIGSGPASSVRLPEAPGVAPLHARVWNRDRRTMLHVVAPEGALVNGERAEWATLATGDTITIGPFTVEYRETTRGTPRTPARPPDTAPGHVAGTRLPNETPAGPGSR